MRLSTVFHVHADADRTSWPWSQPIRNASLNCRASRAGVVLPSVIMHDGRSASRSRGMETSSTRDRSAATCATIVVSDCIPSSAPPIVPFSPLRSSDPMISRFTGDPARASPGGGSVTCGPCAVVAHEAGQVDLADVRLELEVDRGCAGDAERQDADGCEADHPGPGPPVGARVLRHASDASAQVSAGTGGLRGGPVRVCG